MSQPVDVVSKARGSFKWSAAIELLSKTAQPLIYIVLARLLTPEDLGVVGTALIVIGFTQLFWDEGLSKSLVQTSQDSSRSANVVFWTNLSLGLFLYAAIYVLAPWISIFFDSPKTTAVLRVLGLRVIMLALASVQRSLLIKELEFKRLFPARLAFSLIPGLLAIPLAMTDLGVWALVWGYLAGALIHMIILYRQSPWRPTFSFSWKDAKPLYIFGLWVIGEGLGKWAITWGDQVIVGRFLTIDELGIYRLGWNMSSLLFGLLIAPLIPVLYPTFSKLQDDPDRLKDLFQRSTKFIISVSIPAGVGMLLIATPVSDLLFGNKWQGLNFVLGILMLMQGLSWLVGANPEVYRSIGRPDVNSKLMILQILYYLPVYLISIQWGLNGFVIGRLTVSIIALPIHAIICYRVLKLPMTMLIRVGWSVFLSTATMAAVVWTVMHKVLPMVALPVWLQIAILILIGATVYAAALWLIDRPFVRSFLNLLKRSISRSKPAATNVSTETN